MPLLELENTEEKKFENHSLVHAGAIHWLTSLTSNLNKF